MTRDSMDWNELEIAAQSATGKNGAAFSLHFMNIAPGNNTTTPKITSVIPKQTWPNEFVKRRSVLTHDVLKQVLL